MCGISGLYSYEPRGDRLAIKGIAQKMNDALIARGPDSGDVWMDESAPLSLGHRRLSIIDLSPLGAQPMHSHSGRYVIAFNGEIYNFQAIKKALLSENADIPFKGGSDTEVLLAAIEQWGMRKTLKEINGMFAFALWDRKEQALIFARDRFGKKPLYIGWAGSNLLFASELKAFCAHPEFNRDLNKKALTSYMRFGYVPAPLCIYKDVLQILPGSYLAIDVNLLRAGQELSSLMLPFWSAKEALEEARANPLRFEDESDYVAGLEEVLEQCVAERMISDVPLGAFLSGGIDSSVVTALMQKQSAQKIKTYSIGFSEAGYNEADHAQKIAAHLGCDHHRLDLSAKDALDIVPTMPTMYDEPFADASALPTYLVSKFARQDVTVALSGDGGDEMLGGYNRHITGPKAWSLVQNHIPPNLRKPLSSAIQAVPVSAWDRMRSKRPQFGHHMHKFADIMDKKIDGDVYLSLVSSWKKPKVLVNGGAEEIIPLVDPQQQVVDLSFTEEMMYWDALSYLNGDILTKVDRASMAVSLEARAPLLDTRVYDYVWRLPLSVKIRDGKGKWLLRQLLKKYVPEEFFERPKQGFSVPIEHWMKDELRDWAEDLLDEKQMREAGLLDHRMVRKTWEDFRKGRGAHAQKLWTVLMFQAWHKQWSK